MNNKPRVLYISYDGMTDPLGQSQVLPYLTSLSKQYEIHIISAEKEINFKKNRQIISELCSQANISWHPLIYTKSPPVLSTIKDFLILRKTALTLHKKHGFKIIHCRSYISALIGLEMKKKLGTKFLFDMRGFWANERVDGKLWNLKIPVFKWIYNYFKKKEIEFIQQADSIVSLTKAGKIEIESWDSIKPVIPNIEVIPCCADLDFFSPKNVNQDLQNKYKKDLNISDDDYVVSYLGSIGTWYMLDEMLDFFKVLKETKTNSKFLFITKDSAENIQNKAKEKGINLNEIIIQGAERANLPSLVSISTVSIFFILPAYSKTASSPTKQAELFGLGIPVICNDKVGDTGPIVRDNNAGLVIDSFNKENYQKVVDQLPSLESIESSHLRDVASSYASLRLGVQRYSKIYQELAN